MADPVTGEAFRFTLSHIERDVGYLLHFNSNVRNLNVNFENLKARRDDVMRLIDAAKMNNEAILETVETWLSHVENVLNETENLNSKAVRIDRWYKGWVLCSRFSTSRSGQKMSATVKELLEYGNSLGDKVAHRRPNQNLVHGDLKSSAIFESFGSRVTTASEIINALKDDAISLLGIHGMPGVGKTTLISTLATYMKEQKIFDEVVVVTLSQTPEIKVIQGDIANWLDLELDDGNTLTRATQLSQRLSQDRKTLIVLDNLWQAIKLAEIGIPEKLKNCKVVFTTRNSDVCNTMGSKKSRVKVEVLSPEESWDLFRENAGDAVDSRAFQKVARNVLNKCQGLPLLIVTLGNALYEKDIGYWDAALQSLQDSTFLQNSLFTGAPNVFSIMKVSYDYLEREDIKLCFLFCCLFPEGYPISKDQLFHYMMGENILPVPEEATLQQRRLHLHVIVDKLISCCLLLQAKSGCIMMHDVVRDVALAIASGPNEGRGFIVKDGMTMRDWRHKQMADCKRLSFITTRGNHMNWSLPSQIQAAHLLTMSFNGNEKLEEIPSDFFREVTSLLSLDLSYTGIKRLPQSITCLVNLRTLLLEGCFHLEGVDLSNDSLEILILRDSMIESFVASGQMVSLKLLDLSYTSKLQHIGRNIISSFIELEELYLFGSFSAWDPDEKEPGEKGASSSKEKDRVKEDEPEESEEEYEPKESEEEYEPEESEEEYASSPKRKDRAKEDEPEDPEEEYELEESEEYASSSKGKGRTIEEEYATKGREQRRDYARLSEVASLHGLTSLEFHDGNSKCLFQNNFNWEKLKRFKIVVGVIKDFSPFGVDDGLKMEKSMYIHHEPSIDDMLATWVIALLGRTNFLQLSGPWSLSDLVQQDPEQRIFSDLKVLIVSDCVNVTSILIPYDILGRLQYLTKLVITNCYYLKKLIEDTVGYQDSPSPSFSSLTYLRVGGCDNIEFLFSMTVAPLLLQLEKLYISDCSKMSMVIEGGDGSADTVRSILPKLKILTLERLKILSHIFKDVHLEWQSLEELTIKECPLLMRVSLCSHSVPKLKTFMTDKEYRWLDDIRCNDQNVKFCVQLLRNRVTINGCTSLKDVQVLEPWPHALRGLRLVSFKGAALIPCDWLPRLRSVESLEVDDGPELEKLIDFGGEDMASRKQASVVDNSVVADNLRFLKVSRCHKLKYLFPMSVIQDLSQLQELDINDCSSMETIIDFGGEDMASRKQVSVVDTSVVAGSSSSDVVKFTKLIPSPVFPNLRFLKVGSCYKLKYLFPISVVRDLSQLQELHINDCSSMEMIIDFGGELKTCKVTSKKQVSVVDTSVVAGSSSSVNVVKFTKLIPSPVFPNLRCLKVSFCDNLKNLFPMSVVRDLSQLQELHINDCSSMEMIIDFGGELKTCKVTSKKQVSVVDTSVVAGSSSSVNVVKFTKLIPSPVFPNLRCLKVSFCDNLKYLFPMSVVRDLSQLQELHIDYCPIMEIIIVHETDEDDLDANEDKEIFPKLRVLNLSRLGCLLSILRRDTLLDCLSLEELRILNVGLNKLPLGPASAPNLRRLFAYNGWSDGMEWEDEKLRLRLEDIRNRTPWERSSLPY